MFNAIRIRFHRLFVRGPPKSPLTFVNPYTNPQKKVVVQAKPVSPQLPPFLSDCKETVHLDILRVFGAGKKVTIDWVTARRHNAEKYNRFVDLAYGKR